MNTFGLFSLVLIGIIGCQAASVGKPNCGATSSSKQIQLLTPNSPPNECVYTIKASSSQVCQLRLDFSMRLAQPSIYENVANGEAHTKCDTDYLKVNNLKLCGVETNQHIYVPLNRSAGITTLDVSFVTANRAGGILLPTPEWDVLITQLECPSGAAIRILDDNLIESRASTSDGFLVAPPGCLQYFPYTSGTVQSFNLNNGKGIYPGKLNYAICFRRTTKTAGVQLKSTFFHLGAATNQGTTLQTDQACFTSDRTDVGTVDYLLVPQGSLWEKDLRATYFCGNNAKAVTIRSMSPGPLLVIFNSDGVYKQTQAGFSFNYSIL